MHCNVRIQRSAGLLSEVAGISRKEPHADTAKERTFRLKNSKGLRRQRKNFPVEIFEHLHVCPECLQAYAKAVRTRAKKKSGDDPEEKTRFRTSELILELDT